MPRGERQEVQVTTASSRPGDRLRAGRAFTLELEGREPVTVRAGDAPVEPPGVRMTGHNRSADAPLRVVIVHVAEPGTPFLDPAH